MGSVEVQSAEFSLGIDIGGTFTDCVLIANKDGRAYGAKVLTTPASPVDAVRAGIKDLFRQADLKHGRGVSFFHATTLATNALLERKGSRLVLVTTSGFMDILETGRESRYDLFDLQISLPPPLAKREDRLVVAERTSASGTVLESLTHDETKRLAAKLAEERPEAVAIVLLHSYANPLHEKAIAEMIQNTIPGCYVSASSDVLPVQGEYLRLVATSVNSYIGPVVAHYLSDLQACAEAFGIRTPLIMKSSGGMGPISEVSKFPVRMVESGPAAGAVAAASVAATCEMGSVLSLDMGGTTAKAAIIRSRNATVVEGLEIARVARELPGSGYWLQIPSVDLFEIGSGGGSIASVNQLGLLQVGPESAGAVPGPACYGLGGKRPTVTDADLFLGFLGAGNVLGESIKLSAVDALDALKNLGGVMGISESDLAWGIHDLVNENMASALRVHATERGYDPRSFDLVAFGGAGPTHACHVGMKLGLRRVLFPVGAGLASAFGLCMSPRVGELVKAWPRSREEFDVKDMRRVLDDLTISARDIAGIEADAGKSEASVGMKVVGQRAIDTVSVPDADGSNRVWSMLRDEFSASYKHRFGHFDEKWAVEIAEVRVRVEVPPEVEYSSIKWGAGSSGHARENSNCYFSGEWHSAAAIDRTALLPGATRSGPALLHDGQSTILVPPGATASVDAWGNVIVELPEAGAAGI